MAVVEVFKRYLKKSEWKPFEALIYGRQEKMIDEGLLPEEYRQFFLKKIVEDFISDHKLIVDDVNNMINNFYDSDDEKMLNEKYKSCAKSAKILFRNRTEFKYTSCLWKD